VSREDIGFASRDGRCEGWLYRPAGSERDAPCVVMAHGFGALKEGRLDAFAERFSAAGMAVLVFDYRHFGTSTGEPRGLIHLGRQHTDWQSAVACARALGGVDANRIVLWGSSNSGGHVIWVAARDPKVAAVVSQVPHTDGLATMRLMGPRRALRLTVAGLTDAIGSRFGRERRIPIVGPPDSMAAMASLDAEPGYMAMYPPGFEWDNSTPARIALTYGFYSPGRDAGKVACPLLVIAAEHDAITPAESARAAARRAPRGELVEYDCGHFDVYVGEWFERAVADELAFFERALL
jgi:fermentation-respiration switch protein FrsA (DUF1100 family)